MKRIVTNKTDNKEIRNKINSNENKKNATKVKEETNKKKSSNVNKTLEDSTVTKLNQETTIKANVNKTLEDYVKKTSTSDVYGSTKLKNTGSGIRSTTSPTKLNSTSKDSIKATPSSVSLNRIHTINSIKKGSVSSKTSTKIDKPSKSNEKDRIKQNFLEKGIKPTHNQKTHSKPLLLTNVTVNSPPSKRKLNSNIEKSRNDTEPEGRQRKKTRTLNENEVVVLKRDNVDNNKEMKELSNKLMGKPKSFFIDLDDEPSKKIDKSTKLDEPVSPKDEDYSYEDDFESYESDFESYHSDSNKSDESNKVEESQDNEYIEIHNIQKKANIIQSDEERMLDSGNFELREAQRSANKVKPAVMDGIEEDFNDSKNKSLTDEGFLDMNSSNGGSSMNTYTHNEVIERPLFIDFTISKENKKKRLFNERLQQRARDLLPMIKLHEMSYSLFEMKPIPYDIYMATFGKSNHVQNSAQTYDDGIDEEVQTEVIMNESKWTQNPVKFSKEEVYINNKVTKKNTNSDEDLVSKFTFLLNGKPDIRNEMVNCNLEYKNNPMRIYLEQRNGVGTNEMLTLKQYKAMINNTDYAVDRLGKFLKKIERKVTNVLCLNSGKTNNDFEKTSEFHFSRGYKLLKSKNAVLKERDVSNILFSETNNNVIITIHNKGKGIIKDKCLICIWDISKTNSEPEKILVAIGNVTLSKLKGGTEGVYIGALDDSSIHLWDLSELAMWSDTQPPTKKELNDAGDSNTNKTQIELDREWNLQNRDFVKDNISNKLWRASAFTNSAFCLQNNDYMDHIVALEFSQKTNNLNIVRGRKIMGQVCALQRKGSLEIWNIIYEKIKVTPDIGKAYWSQIKLERNHSINLLNYMESIPPNEDTNVNFNINLAKRRITAKRKDLELVKSLKNKINNKTKSNKASARPSSVASNRKNNTRTLPDESVFSEPWDSGVLCNDMKIIGINDIDNYLIAKNSGEVLHCTRGIGNFKINRINICDSSTTITTLETSKSGIFLAGTDSGHVHICSVPESRVLLTLDSTFVDDKGNYLGSLVANRDGGIKHFLKQKIKSIQWSHTNPFYIFTLSQEGVVSEWDLVQSDIRPRHSQDAGVRSLVLGDDELEPTMVSLTSEGEVQIHLLTKGKSPTQEQHLLFSKYISLL